MVDPGGRLLFNSTTSLLNEAVSTRPELARETSQSRYLKEIPKRRGMQLHISINQIFSI
jgi:hypothetical protein